MSDSPKILNLQAEMNADPEAGLRFEIHTGHAITFATGAVRPAWVLRITQPTFTASGRPGKARKLLNVVGNENATPESMLFAALEMFKQGDIEMTS